MNEVIMLHTVDPGSILRVVEERGLGLKMSVFCEGAWHLFDSFLTDVRPDRFDIEVSPGDRGLLEKLTADQEVGISLKRQEGENNFIFDTVIMAIKSSSAKEGSQRIVLAMPDGIELVQKRSYERVKVPVDLQVPVKLRRRITGDSAGSKPEAEVLHSWEGDLINISVGGMQLSIASSQGPCLEEGNFVGLEFRPLEKETALRFNAYVRNTSRGSKEAQLIVGLEMVGLEASAEGRMVIQRIVSVMEEYRHLAAKATASEEF